ncbi:preprotein translocase subunit SecG [Bowmanella pacifica]|uniref:Protein-export membrane protein SecG n=1 Tax=Bowmanella pacifica TaxID=502051 RepID=A0A917Z7C8_9ALTE|nr:preprotein translocase subunit SecG [Bowmanella pacifica]GGO74883.1 preprotein translocase subunit SecG [Bowmanella pacifica]
MLYEVLMVIYLLISLALIGLVLIQRGKGADMGASFGAGASNTVFGASGSGNFLSRSTAILATLFFAISLILGAMTAGKEKQVDEWDNLEVPVTQPADTDVPVEKTQPTDVPN